MNERRKITYTPTTLALKFLDGAIFQEPKEDIRNGKFVRLGKLIVVSPDPSAVHQRLTMKPGLGFGDKHKFLMAAQRLASIGSAQIDAGRIAISFREQTITLWEQSSGLCDKHIIPVDLAARDISREIVEALSPGFRVIAETPPPFGQKLW